MVTYLKRSIAVSVTVIHCCWHSHSLFAAEPFIIDDENVTFETLYSPTVYGFRAFPIRNIVRADWQAGLAIKADVLKASLEQIMPGQSVTLHDLEINPPLVSTITQDYTPVFISADYEEQANLAVEKWSAPSAGEYDARFIAAAFGTELVDEEFVRSNTVTVDQIRNIELNPTVARDLLTVYAGLNSLRDYEGTRIPATFDQFDNALAQHEQLYAVAKLPLGDVDMGQPLILEPSVLRVEVPEEWAADYNVKLILFAITVRDYLAGVEKIDISIRLPEESIAFDLVPHSYVGESVNADAEAETPDLLIQTILGGEIKYERRLKPVVEAYGLQSNEFGWQLRGEALSFGTTRLAALIRSPKKWNEISMESAFVLRGPDSWVVEGSTGSSEPEVHLIAF